MTTKAEKAALRARMLTWRAEQPDAERRRAISAAVARVLDHPAFRSAGSIAAYHALDGEPDLTPVVRAAWDAGKRVALPIVAKRHRPLVWRQHLPDTALVIASFGVSIPPPSAPRVAPDEIDLVVVPALAVDPRGYRVGYGGGYYDRSLPQLSRAARVWVGHPVQIVERVPTDATDQRVHELITETGRRAAVD